eukprot:4597797-Amphidinium_carterae.1
MAGSCNTCLFTECGQRDANPGVHQGAEQPFNQQSFAQPKHVCKETELWIGTGDTISRRGNG